MEGKNLIEKTFEKVVAKIRIPDILNEEECGASDVQVSVVTDKASIEEFLIRWAWNLSNQGPNLEEDPKNPIVAYVAVDLCPSKSETPHDDVYIQIIHYDGWIDTLRFVSTTPASVYLNGIQIAP